MILIGIKNTIFSMVIWNYTVFENWTEDLVLGYNHQNIYAYEWNIY